MAEYTFKPLEESVWEMLTHFWVTSGVAPDDTPGSVLRTLFEAVGFVVEDATYRFDAGVSEAIPRAVFDAFGFEAEGASAARATLQLTRATSSQPLVIPSGYQAARIDGFVYESTAEVVLEVGALSGFTEVLALRSGARGNSGANTIILPKTSLPGVVSVTNPAAATGGRDEESLDEQRRRFVLYILSIHRATKGSLAASILLDASGGGRTPIEVKVEDKVDNPALEPGVVNIYVDDGSGSVPTALLDSAEAIALERRAAGAFVTVAGVTGTAVDVTFSSEGDVSAATEATLLYLQGLKIGQKVSREDLITALTNASGEEITLDAPAADVMIGSTARAIAGTISGTQL